MIRRFLYPVILLFLLPFSYRAQTDNNYKGRSEFDVKNYKADPRDRLIIEVNRTTWLNPPPGIKISLRSIGVNFSMMFDKPLGKSNFSLGYGLGIFSHNLHSNADFIYQLDSTNKNPVTMLIPKNSDWVLNRYGQKILEIPLEVRFRTKTDFIFKIHIGGKIGYVVSDFIKIKDSDGKFKIFDIKNIEPLRYGVHFRIGCEQLCLTACYYLNEVFKKDKGPIGVIPYSIGLAIIPY